MLLVLTMIMTNKDFPDHHHDLDLSQEWGLVGSELLLMLCVASAFVIVVAHTHRSVILRR